VNASSTVGCFKARLFVPPRLQSKHSRYANTMR